jgi:hypothetical protein
MNSKQKKSCLENKINIHKIKATISGLRGIMMTTIQSGFLKEFLQVKVQEKIIHTVEERRIQKVNIFWLSVLNVMNMVMGLMNAQIFCMEIILIRLYKLKMKKV